MPTKGELRVRRQTTKSTRSDSSPKRPQSTSGWPKTTKLEWQGAPTSNTRTQVQLRPASSFVPKEQLKRYNLSHHQHHHHYYDCCNGFEPAAWPPTAPQAVHNALNSSFNANHNYDQNILLFATEHNNQQANKANNVGKLGGECCLAMGPAAGQHQSSHRPHQNQSQVHHQPRSPLSSAAAAGATATGRFISRYPSWRQGLSPSTAHYQNYSFHVPLHHQSYGHGLGIKRGDTLPERRHRAHSSHRGSAQRLSQTSRSRTVEHLQQLSPGNFLLPVATAPHDNYNRAYEEFPYCGVVNSPQQPLEEAPMAASVVGGQQLALSEHNLAHITRQTATQGYQLQRTGDSDNPFKPGTELSWEADLMVRLIRRGYPIQQLPALVESAKQVAKRRGQSSDDLTSLLAVDRETWAGGLSRAKSLCRCNAEFESASRDSIDRLIASIEQLVASNAKEITETETETASASARQTDRLPTTDNKRPATTKQSSFSSSSSLRQEVKLPTTITTTTTLTSGKPTNNRPKKQRQRKSHEHRVKTKDIDCCVLS